MAKLIYIRNIYTEIDENLDSYLINWDLNYKRKINEINLFNSSLTQNWTQAQKVYFAKAFYHARGHFHDFLWYLGNHAKSKIVKDIVLKNISEEMNGSASSHEELYMDFAKSIGADLTKEFVEEETYLDSIKEFNKGHLNWLRSHDEESRLSAFSAYERLDNVDYTALMRLIKSLNVAPQGQLFFKVHMRVQHFESTAEELNKIWAHNPQKVKDGYQFIANHQVKMWNDLSKCICSFRDS